MRGADLSTGVDGSVNPVAAAPEPKTERPVTDPPAAQPSRGPEISRSPGGARPGRARGGLRRHRDEPALRAEGVLHRRARRRRDPGERARRPLAHRLGDDLRRHLQVPRPSSCAPTTAARAASWRCMALVRRTETTGAARRSLLVLGLFGAALLYGDGVITPAISVLGAVEGARGRGAGADAGGGADHRPDPGPASSPSRARHGAGGRDLRPGHAALVRQHRGRSASAASGRSPRCSRPSRPSTAFASSCSNRGAGFLVLGGGGPRSSPAARRSTPTWATSGAAHPPGLARAGHAGAAPQLLRAGGAAAPQPAARRRTPSTGWRPRLGPLPAHRPRDRRHHRGLPGAHLRRLLAHPPGGAARLLPARHRRAHLAAPRRADLHPRGELGPAVAPASRSCSASARSTSLAAAYGIAVTGTMGITTLLFHRVHARPLALAALAEPGRSPSPSWRSTSPSSAPTS